MILKMGRLGCPPNCLCKIFGSSLYAISNVRFKEGTNINNPTFVYGFKQNLEEILWNPIRYDYAILDYYDDDSRTLSYIKPSNCRFYFIDDVYVDTVGLLNVKCHLDVLTQNASDIIWGITNGNFILSRIGNQKQSDLPLADDLVKFAGRNIDNNRMITFKDSSGTTMTPFSWTNAYSILTVAGAGNPKATSTAKENLIETEKETDENSTGTN